MGFVTVKLSSSFWHVALGIWLPRSLGQWLYHHLVLRILEVWFENGLGQRSVFWVRKTSSISCTGFPLCTRVPGENNKCSILETLYWLFPLHAHKPIKGSEKPCSKESSLLVSLKLIWPQKTISFLATPISVSQNTRFPQKTGKKQRAVVFLFVPREVNYINLEIIMQHVYLKYLTCIYEMKSCLSSLAGWWLVDHRNRPQMNWTFSFKDLFFVFVFVSLNRCHPRIN